MADPHSFTTKATLADADEVYSQASPFGSGSERRTTWLQVWSNFLKPKADALYQPADAQLDTWATVTPSANGQSLVAAADYAAMRGLLDLEAGTDFYSISAADAAFQPLDSDLTALAALTTTAAGRSVLTFTDPNADRVMAWDDTAGAVVPIALADITAEASPASGDFFLMYGAEGDLRKVDVDDMPGGAGTDAAAIHDNVSGEIAAITEKTTLVSADLFIIEDSEATNAKKKVQLGNIGSALAAGFTASPQTTLADDDYIGIFDPDDGTPADRETAITYANLKTELTADLAFVPTSRVEAIGIACSDETTALTTGTAKATFRMPFAMTLTAVRATVTTAPTGATLTVDINEAGTTVLSTKLTIDASEKTSTTAATAAVISDSALADDAEITIDIDQIGSSVAGAGLKVWLIGTRA